MVHILLTLRAERRRGSNGGSGVHRLVEWPSVPRMHDAVAIIEGEYAFIVHRVVWSLEGRAHVLFGKTISLDQADLLVEKHGWQPDFAPADEAWRFARTHRFIVSR